MEALATAEKERARQEEISKLQNETCFIGHPFGVGIVSFKYMMGSVTSYGFSAIFIYYLYAATPKGLGLTQLEASQFITLDIALGSIFGVIGSYMADRVFGNRRAYRFCAITAPMYYFSFAIPNVGMMGLILYCVVGYVNSAVSSMRRAISGETVRSRSSTCSRTSAPCARSSSVALPSLRAIR